MKGAMGIRDFRKDLSEEVRLELRAEAQERHRSKGRASHAKTAWGEVGGRGHG